MRYAFTNPPAAILPTRTRRRSHVGRRESARVRPIGGPLDDDAPSRRLSPGPGHGQRRARRRGAESYDPGLFREMRWRMIGPHRGGRTKAAAGIPDQPNVFYIGVNNGGVWKTNDYGRTWKPIFDDQPTGSIGAIAVAPSDPERHLRRQRRRPAAARPLDRRRHLQVHRRAARPGRTSACATASRSRRSSSIRAIPNRLFVAVLGHPYGPNAERGIFRSTDGGETFEKVLYKDENTGGVDVVLRPAEPATPSTPCCGRRGRGRGRTACSTGRAAASSSRPTAARPGGRSRRACRRSRDGLGPHRHHGRAERSAAGCSRPSMRSATAASTARTTPARAGRASTPTRASPSAAPTSPR